MVTALIMEQGFDFASWILLTSQPENNNNNFRTYSTIELRMSTLRPVSPRTRETMCSFYVGRGGLKQRDRGRTSHAVTV